VKFHYKNALLPDDRAVQDINAAAGRLHGKLSGLNVHELEISDQNRGYLRNQLENIRFTLQQYSYLLSWSVAYSVVPYEEFVFIDYGGGCGILSLLAKELGLGTVIYCDICEPSCRDARVLGQILGDEADHYVHGDIDDLKGFLGANSIDCDGIASYDVIEHIYDIESFLVKLSDLSEGPFNVVMSSSANARNPKRRRDLTRFHIAAEYKGRERKPWYKESYCTKPYVEVRKEIISGYAPTLSNPEVERLVQATRGLIESDIKNVVDEYAETGEVIREPDHPTNTCNPYDGNWAERLMDANYLKEVLSKEGLEANVLGGYYGKQRNLPRELAAVILNCLISLFKNKGLYFARFYTVYARKPGPATQEVVAVEG
jgi:2-polyprenyl-3-methyl-5-hydroxy-6-metoxy-1,4-benzoquinol methylase